MKYLIAVLLVFGLTGCGGIGNTANETSNATQNAPVDKEALFLQVVHENAPASNSVTDSKLIELAHAYCDALDAGVTVEDIALSAYQSGVPSKLAGAVLGAGVVAYCPEHEHLIH